MTDRQKTYNVLFLCRANAARSIMAEAVLNRIGTGRFHAYSAGSHPAGDVHPYTRDLLAKLNHAVDKLYSKDWTDFAKPEAPEMDFVFTVCDQTAGEACPAWPGRPMTAHWSLPDPLAFEGAEPEKRAMFADVYRMLNTRLEVFANLPLAGLDRLTVQKRLDEMSDRQKTPA